ncbi:MAG: diguanylate cyclase [Syntrophorhabdaceae bacterium]|nr:diguanylate cyclase [Syntrophorhabdales bacterium]MBP9560239.1 diguanylate cyclase [Syntrophorhabdaceae bacterium]
MSIIDRLTQLIFNIYEAFTVALYIRDKENLRCISSVTFSHSFDKERLLSIERTLPGWVIKHNQSLIIPNFDKDESVLGYYSRVEDIKSFMGYPMGTDGVIVVDSKKKWVFTDKEKKILSGFVGVINVEMDREKKFLEAQEQIDELVNEKRILSLFNYLLSSQASIKDILNESLHVSAADLCFIGIELNGDMVIHDIVGVPEEDYINRRCPTQSCIATMVLDGGRELLLPYDSGFFREKPLFFPNEKIRARQFFGFPLIIDDITFGVAGFVSVSDSHLLDSSIAVLRNITMFLSMYYAFLWSKREYEKIKHIDPVTGSLHFSRFVRLLEEKIGKGKSLCILSIRLKFIEELNRRIGIETTDRVLRKVFHIIRQCSGNNALITRKSGGHFYVLLDIRDKANADNIIRLIKLIMHKNIIEGRTLDIMDTKDIIDSGLAYFPEDGNNTWGLIETADRKKIS